jgi:broad specificity phosphatase PhoE
MSVHITYFVHSTTTDNEKGLVTGWTEGELSVLGKKQAKELSQMVVGKIFDVVFCSDLKRAVDSAQIVFGATYPILQDNRLRECNFGDFAGKHEKELNDKVEEFIDRQFPNGESCKEVEKRIVDFLAFLRQYYNTKHVAIMAHRFPQLALDVLIKEKTWVQALHEDWRKTKSWQPGWSYDLKDL